MKLLYKPFGIIAAVLGARAGKRAFRMLWAALSNEPKPAPGEPHAPLGRVVAASALEAATLAAVGAATKVLSARIFHHFVGVWPEKPSTTG